MPKINHKFIIPLHKTYWGKEEERAAIAALRSGTGVGDLAFSEALTRELSRKLNVPYVLPTGSGTAALELACALLLKYGHEVILPSFTFTSCANAILLAGAKPVFCDIDINTYNIDPAEIEKKITKKTKAIMIVHYAGMACAMDKILKIANENNLYVIEDAAHALGATYNGKNLGTIGNIGCFSFHGTKNVASGEGGVFVTNEKEIFKNAEIVREKGTNRSSFMRGERKKYSWVKVGRSLILSDILSAIAFEQIKKLDKITSLRRKNAEYFLSKLKRLSSKIILPIVSEGTNPNWHIFAIRIPRGLRTQVIKGLREFAATLIRLPMHPKLKKSEIDYIVAALAKII